MNIIQITVLTSISGISSPSWRPSCCRKMTNIVPGYRHVVVRQSCTNGIIVRFRRRFPCTRARIFIRLAHMRTRCCVFNRISGYKFSLYEWDPNLNFLLWVSPDCEMHSKPSAVGDRSTVFDTKFHIGFDVASLSCCISFLDVVWEELVELKWLDANCVLSMLLNKRRRWFHFSKNETARGEDVGKLVLGEKVLRL